jgi:hypothetical protein
VGHNGASMIFKRCLIIEQTAEIFYQMLKKNLAVETSANFFV